MATFEPAPDEPYAASVDDTPPLARAESRVAGASALPTSPADEAEPPAPTSDVPPPLEEQAANRTVTVRAVRAPAARVRVVMQVRRAPARAGFRHGSGRDATVMCQDFWEAAFLEGRFWDCLTAGWVAALAAPLRRTRIALPDPLVSR